MAKMKSNGDTGSPAPQSFEAALERLDEITGLLESGDKGLDESLALYREGVELAQLCQKQLTQAEEKIARLLNPDGTLTPYGEGENASRNMEKG